MSLRNLYLNHVGQTSEMSMLFEVSHAAGCIIYGADGKAYIDMNSGISVSSLGHGNRAVIQAITAQANKHMHTMVYGEHIQAPQVAFAELLTSQLDSNLQQVYYLLSGSEAIELAIKLARKKTGRSEIISCNLSYHGSTLGAESLRSDLDYTQHFAPLIPGIKNIPYNAVDALNQITENTAAIIIEPVQAERGVFAPKPGYLEALKSRCDLTGCLLVFDEIQTGFGRTGHLFAHQKYDVIPDILCIGKAMGAGMPLSGVVTSKEIFSSIVKEPMLGHITTFGGHPVSCAAAHAGLQYLLDNHIVESVMSKGRLVAERLGSHHIVKEVRQVGLMAAVELRHRKYLKHAVSAAMSEGVLVDYFLFNDRSFRVAPPLVIDEDTLNEGLNRIWNALDFAQGKYA